MQRSQLHPNQDKIISIAVVGCGHIGKRHMRLIDQHPSARLSACIDIKRRETIGGLALQYPYFRDLGDFLASPEAQNTDIIHIATPNGLHGAQAMQCLKAGKHVLIEKPMSLKAEDAQEVIDLALAKNKKVFTVMQNRYSPPARWIKSLLESNQLGQIYMVSVHCFWNRDHRYYTPDGWHGTQDLDGGTLYTQFSHFLDMMVWLLGDIEELSGSFQNWNHQQEIEFEDSGMLQFRFVRSGAMGSFIYSTSVWDRNMESSLTIVGEKGSVKIGGQYMDRIDYCHIADYEMPCLDPSPPGNHYGGYQGSASNHEFVIQNVIDVLNGRTEISTNGEEGKKIVELIEQIYRIRDENRL